MTDNLKTRIAEAIDNEMGKLCYSQLCGDNLAQAVLAIVEPMIPKWMPIEGAPKDGTEVLGYWSHHGINGFDVIAWDEESSGWDTGRGIALENIFILWQPLPTPPEKE